jgi:hypothetical protein
MKKQIRRLSPHQNAKVFGILMAVSSLVIFTPFIVIAMFTAPDVDQHGNPVTFPKYLFILFPIFYLIMGYLMTVIGCAIYNFLFRFIGGFEFEVRDENT